MNKADKIRLNQRWIAEVEEKIKVLDAKIVEYSIEISTYRGTIMNLEEGEE